ncbi:hypothetical protein [Bergeyella cardium]|uniref:Uncharacterized protein n=1 Tax=Bergeyella cardium TaxID=1585976 RepID=A0A6P1QRV1_9FLAO|nr:hypothetical protein [Bergeyella cardium]QHN64822.1 hypothetical protein DBX24_02400 [Bergeyella cardium]WHE34128.1 hypothetical protein P8603_02415 [Bergeyella cardium]WHF60779.1 hypothetical protein O0R51_02410 [Bergeyella cardium]
MKIKSLILVKIFSLFILLSTSSLSYADDIEAPPGWGPVNPPTNPGNGGVGGDGPGAKPNTPIDMHTSLLMGLGIAMIASYAYFSKKYNTEKK